MGDKTEDRRKPGSPAPAPASPLSSVGDKDIYSVTQAAHLIRSVLKDDPDLASIWVHGEVSGSFRSGAGHRYFSLKDGASVLRCVLFAHESVELELADGTSVLVGASVDMYGKKGDLQLKVSAVEPMGEGLLYQRLLALKKALEEEGLFSDEMKRTPPPWPSVVGVVTSEDSAALQDVVNVLSRRSPWVRLVVSHTQVQGPGAPEGIVNALDNLYKRYDLDCILMVRGGGSFEDLAAFSDEAVVRRTRASPVPLITGIGHRTDTSLCDMAADLHAPTPSAAAEQCCGDAAAVMEALELHRMSMSHSLNSRLDVLDLGCQLRVERIRRHSPSHRHAENCQRLDDAMGALGATMEDIMHPLELRLTGLSTRLEGLSPMRTLGRGYSMIRDGSGRAVTTVDRLSKGEDVTLVLADGEAGAQVRDVRKKAPAPLEGSIDDHRKKEDRR